MTSGVRWLDVPNGRLWTQTSGHGSPVVLVHGFSFDASSWDDQFDAFSAHHQVTRYDLRGFGRSSLPQASYSHVEDLLSVLRQCGAPAHVVGLSLGANIALSLALVEPKAVSSLVLASSGLPGYVWADERPPEAALRHAQEHGIAAAKRFWLQHALFAGARDQPAVQERLEALVENYSGWHWHNHNPMQPLFAHLDRMDQVSVPTLVAHGGRDALGYREIARLLESTIPGARELAFPDAGHLVNMEAPSRFNTGVLDFIGQVDSV